MTHKTIRLEVLLKSNILNVFCILKHITAFMQK